MKFNLEGIVCPHCAGALKPNPVSTRGPEKAYSYCEYCGHHLKKIVTTPVIEEIIETKLRPCIRNIIQRKSEKDIFSPVDSISSMAGDFIDLPNIGFIIRSLVTENRSLSRMLANFVTAIDERNNIFAYIQQETIDKFHIDDYTRQTTPLTTIDIRSSITFEEHILDFFLAGIVRKLQAVEDCFIFKGKDGVKGLIDSGVRQEPGNEPIEDIINAMSSITKNSYVQISDIVVTTPLFNYIKSKIPGWDFFLYPSNLIQDNPITKDNNTALILGKSRNCGWGIASTGIDSRIWRDQSIYKYRFSIREKIAPVVLNPQSIVCIKNISLEGL